MYTTKRLRINIRDSVILKTGEIRHGEKRAKYNVFYGTRRREEKIYDV